MSASQDAGEGLREALETMLNAFTDPEAGERDRRCAVEDARAALLTPPSDAGSTTRSGGEGVPTFEREDRYIVFKKDHLSGAQLKKLEALTTTGSRGNPSSSHDFPLPTVECVVVEADWPEYEQVWAMIQKRMEAGVPVCTSCGGNGRENDNHTDCQPCLKCGGTGKDNDPDHRWPDCLDPNAAHNRRRRIPTTPAPDASPNGETP